MRRHLVLLLFALGIACSLLALGTPAHAATISTEASSLTVKKGELISIPLTINTGEDRVSGTDVYLRYDNASLHYEGVKDMHYFSYVNAIEDGKDLIHISAVVGDAKDLKKGAGTFVTVTFTPVTSGRSTVEVICAPGEKDSSKIIRGDLDATDVITCSGMKAVTIFVTDTSFFTKAYAFLFGWLK